MNEFPYVHLYTAFNEPNLQGVSPVDSDPTRAGTFWRKLNSICRSASAKCQVGAGDFSDKSGSFTSSYNKSYYEAMGSHQPAWWAVHAYGVIEHCDSVSGCKTGRLQKFLDWGPVHRRGAVWITEAGSPLYKSSGQVSGGEGTQASRLSNFFRSSFYTSNSSVLRRFYYYLWHVNYPQPATGGKPDWGLVEWDRSRTRQIYCVYLAKTSPGTTCP